MANGAYMQLAVEELTKYRTTVDQIHTDVKGEINREQGQLYPENGPGWQEVHDHSQLLRIACGNLQGMLREHLLKTDPRTNTVKVTDEELEAIQALRDGRAYTVPSPINDSGAIYRVYEYQTDALEQDVGIKKGDWVVQHRHPNAGAEGWKNVAGPYKYRKNAEIAMENKIEYHRNKCAGGKQK
jgi:hypothetical protein